MASLAEGGVSFGRAIRRIATGVSVITTQFEGRQYGVRSATFMVASLSPPTLLISLAEDSSVSRAIREAGVFCINVLADGDAKVAQAFAPLESAGDAPFARGHWSRLVSGAPALEDCLVSLDCRVQEMFAARGFAVFAGEVLATELWGSERAPLINHDETFIRL